MGISEEDNHSLKFPPPHNVELLVRAPMELFLSERIFHTTRSHTNAYVRSKEDIFSAVSDSDIYFCCYLLNGRYLVSGYSIPL